MAERIVRQIIDDIDGSEIPGDGGERIEFSFRGVDYQIDLSTTNVAKFEEALKPYTDTAAKLRGSRSRRPKAGDNGKGNGGGSPSKEQLAAIRHWARKNGHSVADRGRLKAEVVAAFAAAH
jgi:hypothetical protein